MIKLGVIGSTKGTDLRAIFDAIKTGELNAQACVVMSNRKSAYILERAKNHNVPAVFISHKGKSRVFTKKIGFIVILFPRYMKNISKTNHLTL